MSAAGEETTGTGFAADEGIIIVIIIALKKFKLNNTLYC
jgi:hypothetical protein